ncbi:RNA 2',3'-cyclic phosphodiesterase [Rheinheimera hassiensis]|uniref:RNA 2',3'-cyclic phosphodiesterase n=1 Tax=Rheinheimera hassiensis TaxID=1193627 RepID=UPI001F054E65|nr:RNA 2',3'-cyclic phosphodiesterase [Rheinheimera hassiensis]
MQRLFFSLKFSAAQQHQLLPYQRQALGLWLGAKAVDNDNLHLTLFFLGQVNTGQQQRLVGAARQIKAPAFSLTLDHLACFAKPKILYLAPSAVPPELTKLQQQVAALCEAEGFSDSHDNYQPHITLARHAVCSSKYYQTQQPVIIKVTEFALYCSDSSRERLRYQPLVTFNML